MSATHALESGVLPFRQGVQPLPTRCGIEARQVTRDPGYVTCKTCLNIMRLDDLARAVSA